MNLNRAVAEMDFNGSMGHKNVWERIPMVLTEMIQSKQVTQVFALCPSGKPRTTSALVFKQPIIKQLYNF